MDRSDDFSGKSKAHAKVTTCLNNGIKVNDEAIAVAKSYVFGPLGYKWCASGARHGSHVGKQKTRQTRWVCRVW
jgi:hypothetical protein